MIYIPMNFGGIITRVNWGNVAEAATRGITYMNVSSGDKKGIIWVKKHADDAYFHTANYWSDDFNQSYIIDNLTGVTYSLSQFPQIYSVAGGLLKVYNESANGAFDYFEPKIVDGQMTFNKVTLPTKEEFSISSSDFSVKKDVYGNMVLSCRTESETLDEYGETKYKSNVILSCVNKQVAQQIENQAENRRWGALFRSRYTKANRYHLGSDGRIYRFDFRGNLSEISVMVLNQNCTWQQVENDIEVDFDNEEGFICANIGIVATTRLSELLVTKIKNGYAYYSTAAHTDGYNIFGGMSYPTALGDYQGVVKIPTNGSIKSNEFDYEHLERQYVMQENRVDFSNLYSIFLVAETKMLYIDGNKNLVLCDVETGAAIKLGKTTQLVDIKDECVLFENYGWLPLFKDVDLNSFNESSFSSEIVSRRNVLDGYFKLLKEKVDGN